MRGVALTVALVAIVVLGVPAATAKPGDGVQRHTVNWTWKADKQDVVPNGNLVIDDFEPSGRPFGPNQRVLTTSTPRSQIGTDRRSGDWVLFVGRRGRCFGTFDLDRNVIETTPTTQTVAFDGTASIEKCRQTSKFNQMKPGKIGTLKGESFCTTSGCSGGLTVKGSVRY